MELYQTILDYLYDKNGIPVWIFSAGGGDLLYASVPQDRRADTRQLLDFFSQLKGMTPEPQLKKVNSVELYAGFTCGDVTVLAGPAYAIHPMQLEHPARLTAYELFRADRVKQALLYMPTVPVEPFCAFAAVLSKLLTGVDRDPRALRTGLTELTLKRVLDRQLTDTVFAIREEERLTAYSPELEHDILRCVRTGDLEELARLNRLPTVRDPNARGTKKQFLFEVVALVTLATRAAIDGGVDPVNAYSLSDLYFKRLSETETDREVAAIAVEVCPHFAELVVKAAGHNEAAETYSPYIGRTVQYIRTHLHYPINLEDVAAELGVTAKYLSRLFVTCTGEKFSTFVQKERVAEAKVLLDNTDRSIVEISNSLAFSSQSYFIKVFTKYAGMTPGKYLERKVRD